MLDVLFERYKSKRKKHFLFYENEFYEIKNKPLQILQVNIEPSLLVWHKYFERSHIFCLDEFKFHQPEHFRFLDEKRIHWLRCNVYDKKNIDNVMKNYWNMLISLTTLPMPLIFYNKKGCLALITLNLF